MRFDAELPGLHAAVDTAVKNLAAAEEAAQQTRACEMAANASLGKAHLAREYVTTVQSVRDLEKRLHTIRGHALLLNRLQKNAMD